MVGAKGGPGATTAVLALAMGWPTRVLVVDADPAGGDVVAGWLAGRAGAGHGLLGFAAATRHLDGATGEELARMLAAELVVVPEAPGLALLPGLAQAGQAAALDGPAWARLAAAVAATDARAGWVDALVDCGRIGPATPWPLVAAADLVLLVVRPTVRGCHHARHAIPVLAAALGGLGRVGLAVCGQGPYGPAEVGAALGLVVKVALPADPASAAVLSDGGHAGRWLARGVLLRTARSAARPLQAAVTRRPDGVADPMSAGWG